MRADTNALVKGVDPKFEALWALEHDGSKTRCTPTWKEHNIVSQLCANKILKCKREKRREHQGFPATQEARREAGNRFPLSLQGGPVLSAAWFWTSGLLSHVRINFCSTPLCKASNAPQEAASSGPHVPGTWLPYCTFMGKEQIGIGS